jgi:hypothetical protein
MTDFEHCVADDGIPDGYAFCQEDSQITLTFSVPPTTSPSGVNFDIFDDDCSIRAGVRGSEPSICETLFDAVFRTHLSLADGRCWIVLQKVLKREWPLLVTEPARGCIAAKSLFMLGVQCDACARPVAAWRHFARARAAASSPRSC